jgi:hypothetical protein
MARPLLERLTLDLKPKSRLADCRRDLAEAEQERGQVDERIADAERLSEDPATPHADAELAHRQVADLQFYAKRLDRAIADVRAAIVAREADDGHRARLKEFDEAKAARDALTERWRALAPVWGTIVELFADTAANDALLAQVNHYRPGSTDPLRSAEIEGRGALNSAYWPNSIGQAGEPFQRLVAMEFPHLDKPGFAWSQRAAERKFSAASLFSAEGERQAAAVAAREARNTPEALAARAAAEAEHVKRYLLSQVRYSGCMVTGVRHRGGVSGVDNEPVPLWLDERQVRAAEKLGLRVDLAPPEEKPREDDSKYLRMLGREYSDTGIALQASQL